MPKYWVTNKWVKSKKQRKKEEKILQGLRVAQAAVTKHWP